MKTNELLTYRPAGEGVVAHQTALARIDDRLAAIPHEIAALDAAYDKAIADDKSTAAAIDRLEAERDELHKTQKQLTALRQAIGPKLEEARLAEKLAQLRAAGEAANALNRAAGIWALGEYRELAAKIIHGLEQERRAYEAVQRYHDMARNSGLSPEAVAGLPRIEGYYTTQDQRARLFQLVELPPALTLDETDEKPVIYCAAGKLGQQPFIGSTSAAAVALSHRPVKMEPVRPLTQEEIDAIEHRSYAVATPGRQGRAAAAR
jgi:hypothetical protein